MSCKKHQWQWLMPNADQLPEKLRLDYVLETGLLGGYINNMVYCTACFKTGSFIKSNKGGVHVHDTDHYFNKANQLRLKFNLPLINQ